jgi:glycosyltransferase involved in cell wall biosynthesis
MKATVFMPTLNGGATFREVLASVLAQEVDFDFEVLILDSESRDGTPEAAAAAGARVLTIPRSQFDHGRARNQGVDEARGEYVVLLTQDATPADRTWLGHLVRALEREPGAIGAYCRQIPRPDCDPFIRDRLQRWAATRRERVVQAIPDAQAFWSLAPLERLERIAFDNVASCVRKSMMNDWPFESRRFGEDVAWSLRVLLGGRTIVYEPEAAVIHSHHEGCWSGFRRVYMDHQNLHQLIGLSLVADRWDLLRQWRGAYGFYRQIVAHAEGLTSFQRAGWRLYGAPYGFFQVLAQYLGPRSNRWRERSRLFRHLDRWIVRRG